MDKEADKGAETWRFPERAERAEKAVAGRALAAAVLVAVAVVFAGLLVTEGGRAVERGLPVFVILGLRLLGLVLLVSARSPRFGRRMLPDLAIQDVGELKFIEIERRAFLLGVSLGDALE